MGKTGGKCVGKGVDSEEGNSGQTFTTWKKGGGKQISKKTQKTIRLGKREYQGKILKNTHTGEKGTESFLAGELTTKGGKGHHVQTVKTER